MREKKKNSISNFFHRLWLVSVVGFCKYLIIIITDFGLVLGCRIYVREFTRQDKENSVQEGDVLLKINNHSTDGLSLKEARKLIENTKEKLSLVVKRERRPGSGPGPVSGQQENATNNNTKGII